ncbi:hypothetical protein F4823DRAFT_233763 [Ustulina deusta]|nr:hypothetical protein F4823DRAFT_233763 [Ustulina deusta]
MRMRMRNALVTPSSTPLSPILQALDNSPVPDSGVAPGPSTGAGQPRKTEESRDWSDLDPLIRELSGMPRKSREEREVAGSHNHNALNPLTGQLMNASRLCAEEVTDVR